MNGVDGSRLSPIPIGARRFQDLPAGAVTRSAANIVDVVVVTTSLLGAFLAVMAIRFVVAPRRFELPAPSLDGLALTLGSTWVVYLAAAWWIWGRTIGAHLMGIRVVATHGGRPGLARASARALLCVVFPVGLLWCVVDPRRRSAQDVVLRTAVIHDWGNRADVRDTRGAAATADPHVPSGPFIVRGSRQGRRVPRRSR